jgi:hypothetical protein
VLDAYASPAARDVPDLFKDPQNRWAGAALRARVIAISTAGGAPPAARDVKGIEAFTDLRSRTASPSPGPPPAPPAGTWPRCTSVGTGAG